MCLVDATAADQGLEKVRLYCAGAVGLALRQNKICIDTGIESRSRRGTELRCFSRIRIRKFYFLAEEH